MYHLFYEICSVWPVTINNVYRLQFFMFITETDCDQSNWIQFAWVVEWLSLNAGGKNFSGFSCCSFIDGHFGVLKQGQCQKMLHLWLIDSKSMFLGGDDRGSWHSDSAANRPGTVGHHHHHHCRHHYRHLSALPHHAAALEGTLLVSFAFYYSMRLLRSQTSLLKWEFYALTIRQCRQRHYVFGLSVHSIRPFVHPDRYYYHDISCTAWEVSTKFTRNIHSPLLMTWLNSGRQRSRAQQASRRGGEDIHVDAGRRSFEVCVVVEQFTRFQLTEWSLCNSWDTCLWDAWDTRYSLSWFKFIIYYFWSIWCWRSTKEGASPLPPGVQWPLVSISDMFP